MATINESKRAHQFIALCVIVTALLFVLIDAVTYFVGPKSTLPKGTEVYKTVKPSGKTMPALP
jgi:hypothetical protein